MAGILIAFTTERLKQVGWDAPGPRVSRRVDSPRNATRYSLPSRPALERLEKDTRIAEANEVAHLADTRARPREMPLRKPCRTSSTSSLYLVPSATGARCKLRTLSPVARDRLHAWQLSIHGFDGLPSQLAGRRLVRLEPIDRLLAFPVEIIPAARRSRALASFEELARDFETIHWRARADVARAAGRCTDASAAG
jgi:hypothetical protein